MTKNADTNNNRHLISKPKCMRQYNLAMDGVDVKVQKVQPYLFERK